MIKAVYRILRNSFYRSIDKDDINLEELKEMQKQGAEIIDVRSQSEFSEGHLDGAINIPEYELKNKINLKKDKKIIVYCISGYRSKRAYIKLKKWGYLNVYNLYGGLEQYE